MRKTKWKTIKNIGLGERFFLGSHMSLMIKTDQKNQTCHGVVYLAVSENGLVEWLKDDHTTYLCVFDAKNAFLHLSNKIKSEVIEPLNYS